jgi:hypothetical protein
MGTIVAVVINPWQHPAENDGSVFSSGLTSAA